ncbi:hypothetical protein [Paraburkholderia caribensis]|uniref:hypothetical protein n=1 Tax=Paraburkholderia caribensis TaxID=75105 RepID=UPI001D097896|nr:hypothetical protein [Paraburkholderia caribensis]
MFETGKEYSREDVRQVTGGSKHAFLPVKGGKVVAARLRPGLNPHAPEVILCDGSASSRAAGRTLARQIEAVPVFVRTSSDRFRYVGEYVTNSSFTLAQISRVIRMRRK